MSSERGKKGYRFNRINESRKESTGNPTGALIRSSKVVPNVGLVMLKLDGSNITSWQDALRHHLEVTYGPIGCFIHHDALLIRPIATAQQSRIQALMQLDLLHYI